VVVTLTREMGPFAGSGATHISSSQRVWVRVGTSVPTVDRGLLVSDTGHEAIAGFTLDKPQPPDLPRGVEQGHVHILGVPAAGLYKGSLQITSAVAAKIELKAQDSIFWPVLVVFTGALVGGGGTKWWTRRRRRELLKAKFLDALERYERGRAEQPAGSPQHPLSLPKRSELPKRPRSCPPAVPTEPLRDSIGLWCWLNRTGPIDALTAPVDSVSEAVDRWLLIAFEVGKVLELSDALGQVDPGGRTGAAEDTERLLVGASVAHSDAASTSAFVELLRNQASVLAGLTDAWSLWTALDGRRQSEAPSSNPGAIYRGAAGDATTRDRADTRELLLALEEARVDLAARVEDAAGASRGDHALTFPLLPAAGQVAGAGGALLARIALPRPDSTSATALVARVRTIDWAIVILTAIVTALAYVLVVYTNTQFGTLPQYLGAFTAGFLGQLGGMAIDWNLFSPAKAGDGVWPPGEERLLPPTR
jgi:hypothetical protein